MRLPFHIDPYSPARPIAATGAVLVIAAGVAHSVEKNWSFHSQTVAGLGVILLLIAVMLRPHTVQTALTGHSARYTSTVYITSAAFLGILILVNFISVKYDYELDLTETRLFTLSPETISLLQSIDTPVQVIGYFKPGDLRARQAVELLERYSHYTPYLSYNIYKSGSDLVVPRSYEPESYGLLFISGDHRHQTDIVTEQSLTGGLMHVTNQLQYMVYFLRGHGEHQPADIRPEGLSRLQYILEQENYRVAELDIAATPVPDDAAVVIIAGAKQNLSPLETDRLVNWMADGGKLMLLVNPREPVPIVQILQEYGLSLPDSFVIEDKNHALVTLDAKGLMPQVFTPMVIHYAYHEITRGLNGLETFFPLARPVLMSPLTDTSKSITPLIATSPGSWAETDQPGHNPRFDPASDQPGPHHLAVAAEDAQTNSRLVLFGDTDFVTNKNLSLHSANAALFINAVNWLSKDESLLAIRPKPPQDRRLLLTVPQLNLIFVTAVIVMPLLVFFAGLMVWWKHR